LPKRLYATKRNYIYEIVFHITALTRRWIWVLTIRPLCFKSAIISLRKDLGKSPCGQRCHVSPRKFYGLYFCIFYLLATVIAFNFPSRSVRQNINNFSHKFNTTNNNFCTPSIRYMDYNYLSCSNYSNDNRRNRFYNAGQRRYRSCDNSPLFG